MRALILGANGQLGKAFIAHFEREAVFFTTVDHAQCDITRATDIIFTLDSTRPDVVINCAAYNLVDDAEDHEALAFQVNAEAPRLIAQTCAERKIKLVHFSTDYVFDGLKGNPYVETDIPAPLSVYAKSKLAGEDAVLKADPRNLVFRLSWLTGFGERNFFYKVAQWVQKSDVLRIADDEVSVPTFADTVAVVVHQALKADLGGLYHLTNAGRASRYELVKTYFEMMGISDKTVVPVPRASFVLKARRPGYSVMSNQAVSQALGIRIPDWREDLRRYVSVIKIKDGTAGGIK